MSQAGGAGHGTEQRSPSGRQQAFTILACHAAALDDLRASCAELARERAVVFDCKSLEASLPNLRKVAETLRGLARLRVHALYGLEGPVRASLSAHGFRDLLAHHHPSLAEALQAVRREQSARRAIRQEQQRSERILQALEAPVADEDQALWSLDDDSDDELVISFQASGSPGMGLGSLLDEEPPWQAEDEEETAPAPRVAPIELEEDEELEAIPDPRPSRRRILRQLGRAEPKYAAMDITRLAQFVATCIRDDGDLALLEALHQTRQIGEKALLKTLRIARAGLEQRVQYLRDAQLVEVLESGRFFKTRQYRLAHDLPRELFHALDWRRRDQAVFCQWLDGIKKRSRREKSL